jgi:hypothetical protein
MESLKLFSLLRGTWDFVRTIRTFHGSPEIFHVTGVATFEERPGCTLRYLERGQMQQTSPASALPAMEVKTEHEWRFSGEAPPSCAAAASGAALAAPLLPATAHVFFADGRHFYSLALPAQDAHGCTRAGFSHLCNPDTYTGTLSLQEGVNSSSSSSSSRCSSDSSSSTTTTSTVTGSGSSNPDSSVQLPVSMELTWLVSGPKKQTEISTAFRRQR